jgi:hypothetical protein
MDSLAKESTNNSLALKMKGVHSFIKCWKAISPLLSIKAQKTIILPSRCKILTTLHGVTSQQTILFKVTFDGTAVEK